MTGMVRKALTIAAGLAVVASVASAGVPDPRFSTVDPVVVGALDGSAIAGGFDVVVRDVNNAPLSGRTVTLDFSATPMRLSNVQNAGTTFDCLAKTLSRVTNASGAVNFASNVAKFDNSNNVDVSAAGVQLALVKGRSVDIDGVGASSGAVSLSDFVLYAARHNTTAQETDFDNSGSTSLGDFVIFASEYNTAGPFCP